MRARVAFVMYRCLTVRRFPCPVQAEVRKIFRDLYPPCAPAAAMEDFDKKAHDEYREAKFAVVRCGIISLSFSCQLSVIFFLSVFYLFPPCVICPYWPPEERWRMNVIAGLLRNLTRWAKRLTMRKTQERYYASRSRS